MINYDITLVSTKNCNKDTLQAISHYVCDNIENMCFVIKQKIKSKGKILPGSHLQFKNIKSIDSVYQGTTTYLDGIFVVGYDNQGCINMYITVLHPEKMVECVFNVFIAKIKNY